MLLSVQQASIVLLGAGRRGIAFLAIVLVGWVIASLVERGVAVLLRGARAAEPSPMRFGLSGLAEADAAGVMARLSKWVMQCLVLMLALDALGMPAASAARRQLLLWVATGL